MPSPALIARLRHLQESSELLVLSSPAAAAHLRVTRNAVAEEQMQDAVPINERICHACGDLLIPGWTCTTTNDDSRRSRRRTNRTKPGMRTIRCDRCNSTTSLTSAKPSGSQLQGSAIDSTSAMPKPQLPDPPIPAVEVSTRPSRKARNSKSTLQSLLASQQSKNGPSIAKPGLDLMDFMKT
ncbi:hypothetical protein BAUCODRAFT_295641 [Baudoinia panamericana UAMH 10762]|uniref:Uncharacterized protein n=1 Tax=Baudoinia panamericana (strain UAMH 10762) TaxID=717646 RepID=M2MJP4_BAUPA|nr:uncharacterized protein BAUCODRAFT_295641 [Baudoinia panamericana UAMH 10762]EMC91528.1 hypothetical protein BAUCODRAFT_295641 [Baudoinia panamericana UAMH 10762]